MASALVKFELTKMCAVRFVDSSVHGHVTGCKPENGVADRKSFCLFASTTVCQLIGQIPPDTVV
jgi:hypothetical protein